jgi:hypothetical protein
MAISQQPTHRAFVVVKRDGDDDFWINVGAAFPHADGKGFIVVLQALPTDGKIVLRVPQEEEDAPGAAARLSPHRIGRIFRGGPKRTHKPN